MRCCSQIVQKCQHLARSGRPDILWSVNKFARAVTKRTRACDRRLARLIACIHHTNDHRLGLFQDSDFAGDLEDLKSTPRGILCIFVSRTIVPVSWMCKKQTSVSHSSTEVVSLDADLRMDGIPALDIWDLVKEVLRSSKNQPVQGNLESKGNTPRRRNIPTEMILNYGMRIT